jgi:MFS family permease
VDGLWSPARRQLTVGLVLTITLVAFEALAISTVMPIVSDDLGGLELYGWVFSAFFLGSLLGIVVVGGLLDRGGLVRPYAIGLGLFAAGLLVGGLAPAMPVLVAGRFLQGLGAGATPPTAYVAIGRSLPDSLRPRMFATLSTAWVLPGLVGPAVALFIGEHLSWRAVFLALLPLIAFAATLTLPALRNVPGPGEAASEREHGAAAAASRRLPNAVRVAAGTAVLLAALTWTGDARFGGLVAPAAVVVVGLLAVGLAVGVPAFRALTPPGTLVAAAGLPAAILLRGVMTFMFFAPDAYVPLALETWRGVEIAGGLALTAATLTWSGASWVQARFVERYGVAILVRLGYATTLVGIAAFGVALVPAVPVGLGVLAWAVAGIGMGLGYAPLSLAVLRAASGEAQGSATSALQLSDVVGTALGTGVAGAIVAAGTRGGLATGPSLAAAFAVAFGAGVVGLALAGRLPGRALHTIATPAEAVEAA